MIGRAQPISGSKMAKVELRHYRLSAYAPGRPGRPGTVSRLRRHLAEIVALADHHADMADDVVGGRAVELHLQHREMIQVVLRLEIARLAADRDRDLRVLLAVELVGPHRLQRGDGLVDARLD